MDGRADGRTDGWMDGPTDRYTDSHVLMHVDTYICIYYVYLYVCFKIAHTYVFPIPNPGRPMSLLFLQKALLRRNTLAQLSSKHATRFMDAYQDPCKGLFRPLWAPKPPPKDRDPMKPNWNPLWTGPWNQNVGSLCLFGP